MLLHNSKTSKPKCDFSDFVLFSVCSVQYYRVAQALLPNVGTYVLYDCQGYLLSELYKLLILTQWVTSHCFIIFYLTRKRLETETQKPFRLLGFLKTHKTQFKIFNIIQSCDTCHLKHLGHSFYTTGIRQ